MLRFGTIGKDGKVVEDPLVHVLPIRGTDKEGYPEVLIDATQVGGKGYASRQSVKPFVGMRVSFQRTDDGQPFNFCVLPTETREEVPVEVGTLNKTYGIKGYVIAQPGHPVFELHDRYYVVLQHDTLAPLKVTFYKQTLEPCIDFYSK